MGEMDAWGLLDRQGRAGTGAASPPAPSSPAPSSPASSSPIRRLLGTPVWRRVALLAAHAGAVAPSIAAAQALVAGGRDGDAEATLEAALAARPEHPDLLAAYALLANNSGRHALAAARWARLRQAAPKRALAWCGVAANARELDDLATAAATIEEALALFPDDPAILSEAARVADRLGRPAEALPFWQRLAARDDAHPSWRRGYAHDLVLLGRHDEAAAELAAAERRFPDDAGLMATRGILAMSRRDWDEAKRTWRLYQARFPDDLTGWDAFGRTVAAAGLDEAAPSPAKVDIGREEDEPTRALLLRFESIGRDCEFGLVQRRYGAEPISLLRWNALPPGRLVEALACRLEGMGDPAFTAVVVDPGGQYLVRDRRWGLTLYTFLYAGSEADASLPAKMARRLVFLRDKFLGDIEAGGKIFVLTTAAVDFALVRGVLAAMRALGPARLLVVTDAADGGPERPGTIIVAGDGLFIGRVRALGFAGSQWRIAFDDWLAVLAAVAAHVDGDAGGNIDGGADRRPAITRSA